MSHFDASLEALGDQERRLQEEAMILDRAASDEAWMRKVNRGAIGVPDNQALAELRNAVQSRLDDVRDAINTLLGVRDAREGHPLAPTYAQEDQEEKVC